MTQFSLLPQFIMSARDIEDFNALPDNLPENKLTSKQIALVDSLYRDYLYGKVTKGWGTELYTIEQQKKWPSGPRVKSHEAKRFVLKFLVNTQSDKRMGGKRAADKFFTALSCRESMQILYSKIYTQVF